MKSVVPFVGLILAAADAARAECMVNKCAHAVAGEEDGTADQHRSDCQAFLTCTFHPAPTTTVVTVTITPASEAVTTTTATETSTSTSADSNGSLGKRHPEHSPDGPVTWCPYSVPDYATDCPGAVQYASACTCLGITRTTITLPPKTCTSTTTVTASVTASMTSTTTETSTTLTTQTSTATSTTIPTCGNEGFQWAYYPSTDDGQAGLSYDPAVIKTETPGAIGVTNYISVVQGPSIYGDSLSEDQFILNHRGYIYTPETGIYTFAGSNIDDIAHVWVGPIAYSGWDKSNAQQTLVSSGGTAGSGSLRVQLEANNYIPFRLVFRNIGGGVGLDYKITSPSGRIIISYDASTAQYSPYAVQYSCDETSAPLFPPFGSET